MLEQCLNLALELLQFLDVARISLHLLESLGICFREINTALLEFPLKDIENELFQFILFQVR